jgi:hypothetical protein
MKLTLSICLIFLINLAALATESPLNLTGDEKELFNYEFILPEVKQENEISKKIDLSFYQTKVSDILLVIAKIANFNFSVPKELDREITVNLHNKTVKEAIGIISNVAGLEYELNDNTLSLKKYDKKKHLYEINLVNTNPELIAKTLNQELFKQLAISQDPEIQKAHAFVNPTTKALMVVANKDQFIAAREFVYKLDQNAKTFELETEYLTPVRALGILKKEYPGKRFAFDEDKLMVYANPAELKQIQTFLDTLNENLNISYDLELFKIDTKIPASEAAIFKKYFPAQQLVFLPFDEQNEWQQAAKYLKSLKHYKEKITNDTEVNIDGMKFKVQLMGYQSKLVTLNGRDVVIAADGVVAYVDEANNLFNTGKPAKGDIILVLLKIK